MDLGNKRQSDSMKWKFGQMWLQKFLLTYYSKLPASTETLLNWFKLKSFSPPEMISM